MLTTSTTAHPSSTRSQGGGRSRLASFPAYRWTDKATEYLILFMVVFSPWAFGTTENWSIWTMNAAGYLLGLLLLNKLLCRRVLTGQWSLGETSRRSRWLTRTLALISGSILVYCLLSIWNPRASWDPAANTFDFFPSYLPWLPHTYHLERSVGAFFDYSALCCTFWAAYDWLMGGTAQPPREDEEHDASLPYLTPPSRRLATLLWVLSVNGALLACQGLIQRADGGAKLLWIAEGAINRQATSQFGPYAYRSNAAQYFNLLWPVVLGFWWWLERVAQQRDPDARRAPHRILLPIAALIAVCPLVALSRAGAIVTVITAAAASLLLVMQAERRQRKRTLAIVGACVVLIGTGAVAMDGGALMKRFQTASADLVVGREKTYELAAKMATDYPVFGTGPGSFEAVFQLYRNTLEDYWPAQLHNDWMETRITFGWVGSALIAAAFALVLLRWPLIQHGKPAPRLFTAMIWIAMVGCLIHARVDFPFQIYSILMLFLLQCAVLFTLAKEER
ncbi:MAG: O-antigen ligase family protein [Verrucomicrobiales bacterium]|nr:O-antigen ligase family protein [Verrucomicrobiales bacterium]